MRETCLQVDMMGNVEGRGQDWALVLIIWESYPKNRTPLDLWN